MAPGPTKVSYLRELLGKLDKRDKRDKLDKGMLGIEFLMTPDSIKRLATLLINEEDRLRK